MQAWLISSYWLRLLRFMLCIIHVFVRFCNLKMPCIKISTKTDMSPIGAPTDAIWDFHNKIQGQITNPPSFLQFKFPAAAYFLLPVSRHSPQMLHYLGNNLQHIIHLFFCVGRIQAQP